MADIADIVTEAFASYESGLHRENIELREALRKVQNLLWKISRGEALSAEEKDKMGKFLLDPRG